MSTRPRECRSRRGVDLILLLQVQAVCFKLWENTVTISQTTCPRRGRAAHPDRLCVEFAESGCGGLLWNEAAATKPFLPLTQLFLAHGCPVSQRGLTLQSLLPGGRAVAC